MNIGTVSIKDMLQVKGGSGAINITGEVARMSSAASLGEFAYLSKKIPARPGDKITLTCLARRLSGNDGTSGSLAIDYPSTGDLKNRVEVNSPHWQEYTCSFTVPETANEGDYVGCTFGVYTSVGGEIEVTDIKISSTKAVSPVVWCTGLITLTAGAPVVHQSFASMGIQSVEYNSSNAELKVKIKSSVASNNLAPILDAKLTHDAGHKYDARAGQFNLDTGEFTIKFIDMSLATPAAVDISGEAKLHVWVNALGV
ncbi:MAG: hypothetical protein MK175_01920 [Pseudoalteromonas sp.]|uniref:hypothetical protein n=1 Tax=Pseudoalteromonas sp. TaxID=53249 RepID=UPI0025D87713|nr:hypothetical protein [Pseudoalteromonas sp.]MCH2085915.1 hypothetical protein [Pseudoalteromonas sp.]